jgi:hypothetical protein
MIAATRLGNFANPKWCFSDTPFYPVVVVNYVIHNTEPLNFLIGHTFNPTHLAVDASPSPMTHVACESIN